MHPPRFAPRAAACPPVLHGSRRSQGACGSRASLGLSLIELLVALCVMAVLAASGVPSLKRLLVNRVADSQIMDFTSALRKARLQALGRGQDVSLCAMDPQSPPERPVCATDDDWSAGWVVFVDHGPHGQIDHYDTVLQVHQRPAPAGPVTAAASSITFLSLGVSLRANTTVRFSPLGTGANVKDAEGTKIVCINKAGKGRVVVGSKCSS